MSEAVSVGHSDDVAPAATFRGKRFAFLVAAVIAALDLWSKSAVFNALGLHEELWLAGSWFGFKPLLNPGVMWGGLMEWSHLLPWMRVVAAIAVVIMLRSSPASARVTLIALGLVLGGALGNIYDGFSEGVVRDFLMVDLDLPGFNPFPIFNVADSAICVGVGLLGLGMLFQRSPEPKPE